MRTQLNFVVDVTLSLTLEEISKLKRLANNQAMSVEDVARRCMNEDADYMLYLSERIDLPI